jgi:hypothetical protein
VPSATNNLILTAPGSARVAMMWYGNTFVSFVFASDVCCSQP